MNASARDILGFSLYEAAKKNDVAEIKLLLLLSCGAEVGFKNNLKYTALHIATRENRGNSHFNAIEVLLKNRANVNELTFYHYTPLYHLAKKADVKFVKLLLDYEADV